MPLDIRTFLDRADLTLEVWSVACISEYDVKVCQADGGECQPTQVITRQPGRSIYIYIFCIVNVPRKNDVVFLKKISRFLQKKPRSS